MTVKQATDFLLNRLYSSDQEAYAALEILVNELGRLRLQVGALEGGLESLSRSDLNFVTSIDLANEASDLLDASRSGR